MRDVSLKNGINLAVAVGTSYATAGIGKGLDKLGGKLASGSIGRGADGVLKKVANTGAGRFVKKYANTAVGKVFVEQGRKLVKNAQNQIIDVVTGAVIGTATNLLVKPGVDNGAETETEEQSIGMTFEQQNSFTESKVPNANQIETIAKISDKPIEQVVSEQLTNVKTTIKADNEKGMSTGVKILGGIAVGGLIWYLVK